jgi:hypothetical protein
MLLAITPRAQAQSLDPIIPAAVDRTLSAHADDAVTRLDINYDDCLIGDSLTFELKLRDLQDYVLEVWAATSEADCSSNDNRQGTTADCWIVHSARPTSVSYTAEIPVRTIAAQNKGSAEVVDGTIEACENDLDNKLNLYFMLVSGGEVQGDAELWDQTTIDLLGPIPPLNVVVETGEESLNIDWDATDSSQDSSGYNIYCVALSEPPTAITSRHFAQVTDAGVAGAGGTAGAAGIAGQAGAGGTGGDVNAGAGGAAGAGGTAGTTTTGGTAGTATVNDSDAGVSAASVDEAACGTSTVVGFTPGQRPAADTPLCGSTGKGAGDGRATGLQNGVLYAVGVAAVDELGNRGKLSNVTCGTPEVVEDFFEIYRASGGKGGGGFCGLSGRFGDAPGAWGATLLALSALIARRRK